MTLDIQSAMKRGLDTGAVMIDYEGTFDAVWREGLLFKIAQLGVDGTLCLHT